VAGRLLALLCIGLLARADAADLLVRDARLIDGTGAPPRPHVSILVRGGRIAAIDDHLPAPEGIPILDAGGATVLPGLIDAHVHLAVVPGSAQRDDAPDVLRDLRRRHLRAYLACGVTTVLDTAIAPDVAREIQGWLAAGVPGPRFLTLGPGFVTPGGYLSDVAPPVATPDDVETKLEVVDGLGAVGVKVFLESGFGPRPVWPIHDPAVRDAIVRGARRHGLPIYAHATREDDKLVALDMGARAITHVGYWTSTPSDAIVQRMARSRVFLMTTFAIADGELLRFHPERLDDPLLRRTVPSIELATACDPAAGAFLARTEIGMGAPWLPGPLRGLTARVVLTEAALTDRLRSSQRAAKRFFDAGVPIVVGTDAGNWPVVPYQFHGPSTLREIELLGQAGLPPADALAAATRVPAAMLEMSDEIGTVEVGKRADLLVVR